MGFVNANDLKIFKYLITLNCRFPIFPVMIFCPVLLFADFVNNASLPAGIQFAGSHLQELQRAFKNPTANLGLIFSEAGRRAGAAVGLGSAPDVSEHVAPALRPAAAELGKLAAEYGRAVEAALVRHGRSVVDQQQVRHILFKLYIFSEAGGCGALLRARYDMIFYEL